ncbi:MAG: efflux RND transporter permease subunit [Cyclobacteriaceae bacterium]|nr:efflux RND transporter permease subunit [Cyclobacteriaceae bacterium]MCH8515145.1 efflux RND transporter permease subunit [Cyclobacteriaceae bacterium]
MISNFFIRRRLTAVVISIVLVTLGLIALQNLPITQYPQISPPVVRVTGEYPGADAKTIEETMTTPLETAINGAPGMIYLESNSSNDGSMTIDATFDIDVDLDVAAFEIQNRVAVAEAQLPDAVRRLGLTVQKRNPSLLLLVAMYSPNGTHDVEFMDNYTNIFVRERLLRVPGVGDVFSRADDFSMRIWLQPDKMSQVGLTASEVIAAVQEQNVEVAAGIIGGPPQKKQQAFEYTAFVNGRLKDQEEFERIILKRNEATGALVYLKDVARVQLGKFDYAGKNFVDGNRASYLLVFQLPGSNILDISEGIHKSMKELEPDLPADVDYIIPFDSSLVVQASINEVVKTLFFALGLVVLVVMIFLQNLRTTLIPILIIPVSLIACLIFFGPLGFSINTLTLFGFVLAIGIVVDDAIVVVEAVQLNMDKYGMSSVEATKEAMKKISGPVIAMSLIVAAVFIPVSFIPGIVGRLYQQFAITIALSGLISGFVALSLTPALCAMFLKAAKDTRSPSFAKKFQKAFDRGFERFQLAYMRMVAWSLRNAKGVLASLIGLFLVCGMIFYLQPTGFIPTEDEGRVFITFELPEGASTERTVTVLESMMEILQETEEVAHFSALAGLNVVTFTFKSNSGTIFTQLTPWEDRTGKNQDVKSIREKLLKRFEALSDAEVVIIQPPAIPGLGTTSGFSFVLQEKSGNRPIREFESDMRSFIEKANEKEEISGAFSFFSANYPAYQINLDREEAQKKGVPIGEVFTTLQTFLGSFYINDFVIYGRSFRVVAQADTAFRDEIEKVNQFYVRNQEGREVPLESLVSFEKIQNAPLISHYNLFRSILINGDAAPGFSSGQAIAALREVADKELPSGYSYEFSGLSREEKAGDGSAVLIFGLSLFFVFLCLTALYESWSVPMSVLLAVPTGVLGAGLALLIWPQLNNNVYAQIGLVTLIGLSAKNAILIVEYAKERVDSGSSIVLGVMRACQLRFRPILMTSFAFIFGVLPLALASGAGALARQSIGWTVLGGMITATALSLFFVPVLFLVIGRKKYQASDQNIKT